MARLVECVRLRDTSTSVAQPDVEALVRGCPGAFSFAVNSEQATHAAATPWPRRLRAAYPDHASSPPSKYPCPPASPRFREPPACTGSEDYDVIGKDGEVVGRIMKTGTAPAGMPWMWSLAARRDGEGPVLGYEPTREAAMEAFARVWHPE
jgi:hypothetical protein